MPIMKVLAWLGLIGSAAWLYFAPDFEPVLAVLGSMSTLIALYFVENRRDKGQKSQPSKQHQTVSRSSVGIQAGGDVTVGDIGGKKDA